MRRQVLRERVREAFWLIPAACVAAAAALAVGLLELDEALQLDGSGFAFAGGPSSARDLLGSIASSLLTLTALVFSITLVILQLTSSQFSPRVLGTFLHDRQNQVTLGVFTGTYVYALVGLRAVRGQDGTVSRFVPGVTVTVAFGLTVLCVGLLVAYIHHITQWIRIVNILARIGRETEVVIEQRYPMQLQPPAVVPPPAVACLEMGADRPGVLTVVEDQRLVELAEQVDCRLWVVPHVGDFVPRGAPLLRVFPSTHLSEKEARGALRLEPERSVRQDVAFGLRQLVDVAEKALSPGINDPTTAVQCLDQIHHLLRQLAVRPYPTGAHPDRHGDVRLVVPEPSWADHVALALDEIRHWGANSLQIHRRLRALVLDLLDVVDDTRRAPLVRQLELITARVADLPSVEQPGATAPARPGTSARQTAALAEGHAGGSSQ